MVMNIGGTGLRNLTNHPAQDQEPEFAPDGKRLLFDSERNGSADIFVMNVDGSNLVQLTASFAKEDHGAWSPDSKFIAFQYDAGDNTEVHVMNSDGSNRIHSSRARDGWPAWSPDGERSIATKSF